MSRSTRLAKAVLFGCAMMTLTMCARSTTAADPASEVGKWNGSIADDRFGAGTFQLLLEEQPFNDLELVGDWTATFANGRRVDGRASLSRFSAGTRIRLDCSGGGSADLTATVAASRMTGTYISTTDCTALSSGSVNLSK